jgi:hypothetical protein
MVKVIGAATVLVHRMGDAPMCRSATTGHWIAVQGGRDAGVHGRASNAARKLLDAGVDVTHKAAHRYPPGSMSYK